MTELEINFYKEIKSAIADYLDSYQKGIKNINETLDWSNQEKAYKLIQESNLTEAQVEALRLITEEVCVGLVHSILTSIDGATALSSEGKALVLIDNKTKKSLTEGALHENFMDIVVG